MEGGAIIPVGAVVGEVGAVRGTGVQLIRLYHDVGLAGELVASAAASQRAPVGTAPARLPASTSTSQRETSRACFMASDLSRGHTVHGGRQPELIEGGLVDRADELGSVSDEDECGSL